VTAREPLSGVIPAEKSNWPAPRGSTRVRGMRIEVNGEAREVAQGTSVAALLQLLGVGDGPVAVERNREIVPRGQHASTPLQDGDVLEVVHFVGGG